MSKGTLEIHSENILPIIKKWLYSDHDVFVRELISNSCDAIQKLKLLGDRGEVEFKSEEARIEVRVDKEKQTITFSDTGIGMDSDEVKRYIAQIAFSSAEEFVEKYKSNKEEDQIIGHFGLGFYSSYMVADRVEVDTLSYRQGAEPALWSCDGSREYELTRGTRTHCGTTITLHIGQEHHDYLEVAKLRQILQHYCSFLPYPIYLGEELINKQPPLWMKPIAECTKEDYLQFYRYLYPMDDEPLFWIHLNVDYPFHLQGILYFPKIHRHFDMEKQTVKLYCNRVFVADNCKDVLPEYLMMLRGVVDSPDIPLNVSRSYLQMDKTVRQLASHIAKKVSDSLLTLLRSDRERYIAIWEDVSTVVKLGALEDEKFYERVKEALLWKNTEEEWTTVGDYLERQGGKTEGKVFYTTEASHFGPMVQLYRQKGIEVICASSPIDSYLLQFLEKKLHLQCIRVDGALSDQLLDKEREKTLLDAQGRTESSKLAELVQNVLGDDHVEVQAKSLAADALPAFVLIDEQQRRMRDYMLRMGEGQAMPSTLFGKHTLVLNTNNKLVNALVELEIKDRELARQLMRQIYQLALLSQREMEPSALNSFVQQNLELLEQLTLQATK